jgi:hypothetical protein
MFSDFLSVFVALAGMEVAPHLPWGELVLLLVAARLWVLSTALPVPLLDDLPPLWCILVKSGHPASAVPAADVAQW